MAYIKIIQAYTVAGTTQLYVSIETDLPELTEFYYQVSQNIEFTSLVVNDYTTALNHTTAPLPPGGSYFIRVISTKGVVSQSQIHDVEGGGLGVPTITTAKTSDTSLVVTVSNDANASGSEIQRATQSDFSNATTIYTGTGYEFEDTGLAEGTYYYRAKLLGEDLYSDSPYSSGVTVLIAIGAGTTLNAPNVSIVDVRTDSINVRVLPVTNGELYQLEYSDTSTFTNAYTLYTGATPVDFVHTGLSKNQTYYYRARALSHDAYYQSAWSATANATTLNTLDIPVLTVVSIDENSITVNIAGVPNGNQYYLQVIPLGSNVIEFTYTGVSGNVEITGLEAGIFYKITVKANTNGSHLESNTSTPLTIKTVSPIEGYGKKYVMEFRDIKNIPYEVRLFVKGFSGAFTNITGDSTPITITYTGDDNNPFNKVIVDFKATLNILLDNFNANVYDDLTTGSDTNVWVEIANMDNNFFYSGWLIPDLGQRTFDETTFAASFTIVDPLSLMKGKSFLDGEGFMFKDEMFISDIIKACLETSIPKSHEITLDIDTSIKEIAYTGSNNFFETVKLKVESFNDENGRPPKCYDLLERILKGFNCFWFNGKMYIKDIYKRSFGVVENKINIKTHSVNNNFFIGNTEIISKVRGVKELSNKIDYGTLSGLLRNGRMMRYGNGVFEYWNYGAVYPGGYAGIPETTWSYTTNVVSRVGTGREIDPYAMRITGYVPFGSIFKNDPTIIQGVNDYIDIDKGDLISIKVKYRYRDYYGQDNTTVGTMPLSFMFMVVLAPNTSPNPNFDDCYYSTGTKDHSYWSYSEILQESAQSNGVVIPSNRFIKAFKHKNKDTPDSFVPYRLAIDSVSSVQDFSADISAAPIGGRLYIMLIGSDSNYRDRAKDWVDILEFIVSKKIETNGTNVKSEQTYLTQAGDFSLREETKEMFVNNNTNKSIGGVLYKQDNSLSEKIVRDGESERLYQDEMLISEMALRRNTRNKIDFDCVSNNIYPYSILSLEYEGVKVLPNNYYVLSYSYDIKHTEIKITALEMLAERRDTTSVVVSDTKDLLENFKLSN